MGWAQRGMLALTGGPGAGCGRRLSARLVQRGGIRAWRSVVAAVGEWRVVGAVLLDGCDVACGVLVRGLLSAVTVSSLAGEEEGFAWYSVVWKYDCVVCWMQDGGMI